MIDCRHARQFVRKSLIDARQAPIFALTESGRECGTRPLRSVNGTDSSHTHTAPVAHWAANSLARGGGTDHRARWGVVASRVVVFVGRLQLRVAQHVPCADDLSKGARKVHRGYAMIQ